MQYYIKYYTNSNEIRSLLSCVINYFSYIVVDGVKALSVAKSKKNVVEMHHLG